MSNSTDTTGCVSHRANSRFFIIFEDYQDIARAASGKEHENKLAAFWRVLETKTNDRITALGDVAEEYKKKGEPIPEDLLWVEIPYSEFENRSRGVFKSSSFQVASAESERIGFSKSRVLKRKSNPDDPNSPLEDYKVYLFLTSVMQSALNGGKLPTPIEINSPLLKSLSKRKQERKRKRAIENNTTPIEINSPPIENNTGSLLNSIAPPIENNRKKDRVRISKDKKDNEECFGATAPAPSAVSLQEKTDEIPVTYADCLALLQEHNVTPKGDAVAIMVQARTLYALAHTDLEDEMSVPYARQENDLQEKGQTDGSSDNHHRHLSSLDNNQPLRHQLDTVDNTHGTTPTQREEKPVEQKGHTDASYSSSTGNNHPSVGSDCLSSEQATPVAQQTPTPSKPVQVLPPLEQVPARGQSGTLAARAVPLPEQAALMAPAEPKARAKAAPKKAVEKPVGPPVAPPSEMEWSTRKCMMLFDFWRGAPLIGTYKNSQASTCAKGLAANYTEQQVIDARTDMEADIYWMSHGGVDICEVANNIHKYVKKRQGQQQQKVPVGPKLPPRMPTLKELENEVY